MHAQAHWHPLRVERGINQHEELAKRAARVLPGVSVGERERELD